ncbi:MAG TPA: GMC family oxidoreductase N-terminal domain-containing protein [Steroidobacteraceae bacterium]|jgi:choline dehydrogenase|nr:GMC family oxidoreductase N-terminal domain-containing protein [Steroidobacteraceae bacterium]
MTNYSKSYDYIIVGGGSAGCVLAARLSAEADRSVLLLEAGGSDNHFLLRMPLGFLRALFRPELSWGYFSEPEPNLGDRRLWLPRGKVLGGSGSINGMFYMRGHSNDFNTWRNLGCEGWGYREVLPYFRRMETSWRGAGPYHGDSGPLPVTQIDTAKLLHEPLMRTAAAAGFNTTEDLHAQVEEGFARGEVNIDRHGRRASTSRAYLHPVMGRENLTLEMNALTTRVLIEKERAVGVEYVQNGHVERVYADREVILCGGSYNSPQLLMLSGIGPAAQLRRHGIEPVVDLPGVGGNLSEHPHVPMEFAASRPVTFLNELRFDRLAGSVIQWVLSGTGPLATQINSCNIVIRTRPQLTQPDIQLMCNPVRMDAKIWFPGITPRQDDRITAGVVVLHQKSRGRVSLASAKATDAPRILLNLFEHPEDLETAKRGMEAARHIYGTQPQADLVARETSPGIALKTDQQLEDYIRATASVTQHPVGTCAMGIGPDSVVNPQLRVYGTAGLRVVDASIMPTIVGANTNAAVIMIAEKASDMILGNPPLAAATVN